MRVRMRVRMRVKFRVEVGVGLEPWSCIYPVLARRIEQEALQRRGGAVRMPLGVGRRERRAALQQYRSVVWRARAAATERKGAVQRRGALRVCCIERERRARGAACGAPHGTLVITPLQGAWGAPHGTRYVRHARGWYANRAPTVRGAPGQAALRLRYVQRAGGWCA